MDAQKNAWSLLFHRQLVAVGARADDTQPVVLGAVQFIPRGLKREQRCYALIRGDCMLRFVDDEHDYFLGFVRERHQCLCQINAFAQPDSV